MLTQVLQLIKAPFFSYFCLLILAIVISLPAIRKYLIPFACKFVFNIDLYIFKGGFILILNI